VETSTGERRRRALSCLCRVNGAPPCTERIWPKVHGIEMIKIIEWESGVMRFRTIALAGWQRPENAEMCTLRCLLRNVSAEASAGLSAAASNLVGRPRFRAWEIRGRTELSPLL
jgi:hypothetical protein